MADYSKHGTPSPEWVHLTATTPIPAPIFDIDPVELQRITNAGRETVSAQQIQASGLSSRVSWDDRGIPSRSDREIPIRIYRPRDGSETTRLPIYVFFHGGGYIFGTLASEDAACARIAAALPIIVVNVCYSHTPQSSYPSSHSDAWDALEWLFANDIGGDTSRLLVGGISAGGGLAASVVMKDLTLARKSGREPRIRAQILCIPWLIYGTAVYPFHLLASEEKSSIRQCKDAPILPQRQLERFTRLLGDFDPRDPYLSVGNTTREECVGMPRAAFLVAGLDPLRDEALLYAERLGAGGVPVKVHIFPGLPHGFRRFNALASAGRWDEVIVESIKWALEGKAQPGAETFVENPLPFPKDIGEKL